MESEWLRALALVRQTSPEEVLHTVLRHVRVTPTERQRVAYYRMLRADGHYRVPAGRPSALPSRPDAGV